MSRITHIAQAAWDNIAAMGDAILNARTIAQNAQKMTDLMAEARRAEAKSPLRAAALRNEARRVDIA